MRNIVLTLGISLTISGLKAQDCNSGKATLNDLPSLDVVSIQVLLDADSLALLIESCNKQFQVISFDAHLSTGNVLHSYSNRLTDEMKKGFSQLRDGDSVTFDGIKIHDRTHSGPQTYLEALTLQVMKGEGY